MQYDPFDDLTEREREVYDLLGEGYCSEEIAERLYLSRKTAEHHVRTVKEKMGFDTVHQLVVHCVRQNERKALMGGHGK